jgi:hypothetical protein
MVPGFKGTSFSVGIFFGYFEQISFQSSGRLHRFWDWTNLDYAKDGIPDIFQTQTYTFKLPGRETSTTIDNPLASFDFGSRHPDGFQNFIWKTPMASQAMSFFKDWQRTYRWPTGKLNPTDDYIKIKELSFPLQYVLRLGLTAYSLLGSWPGLLTREVHAYSSAMQFLSFSPTLLLLTRAGKQLR